MGSRRAERRLPTRGHAAVLGLLLVALAGLTGLVAPGSAQAAPGVPVGGSWVRIGHFVPGMGAADVVLTADAAVGGAAPGDAVMSQGDVGYGVVTDYSKLTPGSYTATVSAAPMTDGDSGSSSSSPDDLVLSSTFQVTAGQARTVAVLGTSDAPRLTLLDDDLTPPQPGAARVRVLSASEQMGSIAVRAIRGPVLAEGAVLGQATDYVSVPAGAWELSLTDGSAEPVRQQVDVASGSVYTLVVLDSPDGGVEVQAVTDAAGAAVAPRGGADTGGGGTAVPTQPSAAGPADGSGAVSSGVLGGLTVLVAGALLVAALRPRRTSL